MAIVHLKLRVNDGAVIDLTTIETDDECLGSWGANRKEYTPGMGEATIEVSVGTFTPSPR